MDAYEIFLQERIEIGAGRVAKVYSYNGYAYKCFNKGYPGEWIDFEYNLQQEIARSGLPIPNYYRSEFPNSIRMDLINGVSMYDRLATDGEDVVMNEMMSWFARIHEVKGLKLQSLSGYMLEKICEAPASDEQKRFAKQCLSAVDSELSEPEALCHMDYHFLNVMCADEGLRIIDWTNAKNGKPIWDYARTYVIFYEHAADLVDKYLQRVSGIAEYPRETFLKAAYVNAMLRLTEHDTDRVRQLVGELSTELSRS